MMKTKMVVILLVTIAISLAVIPAARSAPTTESLTVSLDKGPNAATTSTMYSGNLWITVSGTGQAAGSQWSDGFYVFTDGVGQPLQATPAIGINLPGPWHCEDTYNWVLSINGQHAENWIPDNAVPAYNSAHEYAFQINVPTPTLLTFGVNDVGTSDNTGNYVITVSKYLPSTFDLSVGTINLKSHGSLTCYLELPENFDVNNIVLSSIRLNETITIDTSKRTIIGDGNLNGIQDLMVKFDRDEIAPILSAGQVTLTITLALTDGTTFTGSDTVKVIG